MSGSDVSIMSSSKQGKKKSLSHCGVPQCNKYKSPNISMHRIPKDVLKSPKALKKWAITLRMGKKFPKKFLICSDHFQEKDLLIPKHARKLLKVKLIKGAFPSRNLPTSIIPTKKSAVTDRETRLKARSAAVVPYIFDDDNNSEIPSVACNEEPLCKSIATQVELEFANKTVQVNMKGFVNLTSLWDTDSKLNTMTGIPTIILLDKIVKLCLDVRQHENCSMSLRDRVLLTMHILKSNCSFAEVAIGFQICPKTAKLYFADTIQLLSKIMKGLIYWQTHEQNRRSLPTYFRAFPNVMTVLDCTEIKTVTFRCLTCRTCTYSHYKGTHTLKVLIGVTPSGSINYVSKVSTGKSSDKAILNLSDLLEKLQPGDAVMVDKGFMIADELANAGIEMIRPDFLFEKFSKTDVERNTKIASARVHVERRIQRIKIFKVLSDKVGVAIIPYIDDIMTVLCGLSNISPPMLRDDKFV